LLETLPSRPPQCLRFPGRIQITSDSYRPYQSIVRKHLLGRLDFATMQKLYATPYNMRAEATRRYAAPICTGVRVRIQAGAPRKDRINTSFVERANLSVRHFTKRFGRLGLGWSRTLENHRHAVCVFVCAHNFCKIHSTLGTTPAHGAKITDSPWTIERLIEEATK
jgi:IS1 family transposase